MNTEQEYRERFIQLLRVMYEVRDKGKGFGLWEWYVKGNNECGTTACVIGWAAMDPWFNKQGLRLNKAGIPIISQGAMSTGWFAVREFFDVSSERADELFTGYRSLDSVIKRIEIYVKNRFEYQIVY